MFSPCTPKAQSYKKTRNLRTPKTPKKSRDRYIANRDLLDINWSEYMLKDKPVLPTNTTKRTGIVSMECSAALEEYTSSLVDTLFPERNGKVFSYRNSNPLTSPSKSYFHTKEINPLTPITRKKRRVIPKAPEKILDAPAFIDDYYLNLLDWSSDNILAVALERSVYLWNASTGGIDNLMVKLNFLFHF